MKPGAGRFALGWSVDEDVLVFDWKVFKRELQVDFVAVSGKMNELEQVLRGGTGPESSIEEWFGPVGDDLCRIEVVKRAETMTLRAGAKGGVEAETARLELGDVETAVGTGHGGGEKLFFAAGDGDEGQSVG